MRPAFLLSLDFELHWGLRDHTSIDGYRENLLGVREAVPALLDLFARENVACTWATVGMLMADTKVELLDALPAKRPEYRDRRMSPYDGQALSEVGEDEASDPFHFAATLVRRIAEAPRQELATHTFSHYYALEPGADVAAFDADLAAAMRIAEKFGRRPRTLVFPRNQFAPVFLDTLRHHGIVAYRSNGPHWAYAARAGETPARRAFRLADAYAPLSGARVAPWPRAERGLVDLRASAFLRPYSARLRRLEALRLRRITSAMTAAAEENGMFHLWWHPHNFGVRLAENLAFLERVLLHLRALRDRFGMESLSMLEAAERVLHEERRAAA